MRKKMSFYVDDKGKNRAHEKGNNIKI